MLKKLCLIAAAMFAYTSARPAVAAILGPDAAACAPDADRPALLVNVSGLKNRAGTLRVQLYGSNPSDFLKKGKKLRRIDLSVTARGPMAVCVAIPRPGSYAIAIRHDADANNRSGWNDGGGFARNPKLSLLDLKPKYRDVSLVIGNGMKVVNVVMNYRNGLSIGPVAS